MMRIVIVLLLLVATHGSADALATGGSLEYLSRLRGELLLDGTRAARLAAEPVDRQADLAPRLALSENFTGSIRFVARPSAADFERLVAMGVRFIDHGDGPLGSRTVFAASIPWIALEALQADPAIARIEAAWRPGAPPPLVDSRPQIETELAWAQEDGMGDPLTGKGVVVCDIDTGVWYYQHNFFKLGEERFDWLDLDLSGGLSAGDAVDLDDDGLAGADEDLRFIEADGVATYGNGPGFDAEFDWLYNDANANAQRDVGPPDFGENDPCYGERLFIVDDLDGDGVLDPGEELMALAGSKIRAIYNKDGSVHTRGVDLLQSESDDWGHGTQVSGIFGGGWADRHAMTGIAPGVESLHVNFDFFSEPPFLMPIEAGLAWSVAEGADIVLIEDGEWIWEYMDGSSNLETMMNEMAADQDVIFIVPAGNLATGHMHAQFSGDVTLTAVGSHVIWMDFLWSEPQKPQLTLTPPGGAGIVIPNDGSTVSDQGYDIYGLITISDRGTRRWDLRIEQGGGGGLDGDWQFHFSLPMPMHAYFVDDVSGWYSASSWSAETMQHTVTWPATADSAISVAAYNPAADGDINSFSGWGPRIDGRPSVDIAAPGSTVYTCRSWGLGQYTAFGGTSSAGPHVAGAAALLRQLFPSMDNGLCRALLRAGAGTDEHTGDPDRWGAGKLRIAGAIAATIDHVSELPEPSPLALTAHPNPFNPVTTLHFTLPSAGTADVRIFTVDGRQVWSRRLTAGEPGTVDLRWNGTDARGRALPSGLYFAHVRQGDHVDAVSMTLLK